MPGAPPLDEPTWDADDDRPRLRPIPGESVDPPPKDPERVLGRVEERSTTAGVLARTVHRFLQTRAPLLAAGTSYFLFLSLISLLTFSYGMVALFGADFIADLINRAVENAFPGLVGEDGLSPEDIRGFGSTTSILSLIVLLFASTGAVHATKQSVHLIYGAHKDPRPYLVARLRMLAFVFTLGPLLVVSFAPSLMLTSLAEPLRDVLDLEGGAERWVLVLGSTAVSLSVNYLVVYVVLGWLGGIRPPKRPHRIGALVAAIMLETLKHLSATIVSFSVSRPQYGALAVPITIGLVLFLFAMAIYLAASLTAVVAIRDADRARAQPAPSQP